MIICVFVWIVYLSTGAFISLAQLSSFFVIMRYGFLIHKNKWCWTEIRLFCVELLGFNVSLLSPESPDTPNKWAVSLQAQEQNFPYIATLTCRKETGNS